MELLCLLFTMYAIVAVVVISAYLLLNYTLYGIMFIFAAVALRALSLGLFKRKPR